MTIIASGFGEEKLVSALVEIFGNVPDEFRVPNMFDGPDVDTLVINLPGHTLEFEGKDLDQGWDDEVNGDGGLNWSISTI